MPIARNHQRYEKRGQRGNLGVGGASRVAWLRNRAKGEARRERERRKEEVKKDKAEEEEEEEAEKEEGDVRIAL